MKSRGTAVPNVASPHIVQLHSLYPRSEWHGTIIATDGADDIKASRCYPGTERSVGNLQDFMLMPEMWANPESITRSLRLMNSQKIIGGVKHPGILADDTTIVMVQPHYEEVVAL
jgi:hypothetical protein